MEDTGYPSRPEDVHVYPGTSEALLRMREAGYLLVLVTNQAGIGRGYYTEADYERVQAELFRQIAPATLDGSYFAPDAPGMPSTRRKPAPGMVLEAAQDLQIDLGRSFLVGDKPLDVECALNAGVRPVQVRTGYGAQQPDSRAEYLAQDLADAAAWILRQTR
jgi:D-glycero-D-manno-heptose 1,7-bisphosphate phosphatase